MVRKVFLPPDQGQCISGGYGLSSTGLTPEEARDDQNAVTTQRFCFVRARTPLRKPAGHADAVALFLNCWLCGEHLVAECRYYLSAQYNGLRCWMSHID